MKNRKRIESEWKENGKRMENGHMILFEDRDIIVCHKTEGIPVQSARIGQKDMVSILNNHLAASCKPESVYVVHRLDQPVEGVMVFAKTKKAAAGLTKQITEGSMEKVYHAVCLVTEEARSKYDLMAAGQLQAGKKCAADQAYTLIDYLIKDGRTNTSRIASKGLKDAKEARLSFRVLELGENCLLAEIHLDTGRHHQIRVQMAHAGLPLIGDRKYNKQWENLPDKETAVSRETEKYGGQTGRNAAYEEAGRAELALCAVSLTFRHPVSGKRMKFEVIPKKRIFRNFENYRTDDEVKNEAKNEEKEIQRSIRKE